MAYLRFREDCKVYFLQRVDGGWECCGCLLHPQGTSQFFVDLDTAARHLYAHVVEGHLNLHEADRVNRELRGQQSRQLDLVLQDMIGSARAQGARIVSDDADVPADLCMTSMQLLERLRSEADDPQVLADIEDAIKALAKMKEEAH